jgi:hypothetical protein
MAKTNKPQDDDAGPQPELHIQPRSGAELAAELLRFSVEPANAPDSPPRLRKVKRLAIERQQIEFMKMIVSPMMAADLASEYRWEPINPQTRQPRQEPARRAIKALFGAKIPDAAQLPNKFLAKQVTEWLEKNEYPVPSHNTILRAAGRK